MSLPVLGSDQWDVLYLLKDRGIIELLTSGEEVTELIVPTGIITAAFIDHVKLELVLGVSNKWHVCEIPP